MDPTNLCGSATLRELYSPCRQPATIRVVKQSSLRNLYALANVAAKNEIHSKKRNLELKAFSDSILAVFKRDNRNEIIATKKRSSDSSLCDVNDLTFRGSHRQFTRFP